MSNFVGRLRTVLHQLRLKVRNSPLASRALTIAALVTACLILYKLSVYLFVTDISYYTEWRSCPACYGTRMCMKIHQTSVHGKEGFHHINYMTNIKNVYFGRIRGEELVYKKLAHDGELSAIDVNICHGGFTQCTGYDSDNKFCVSPEVLSDIDKTDGCDRHNALRSITGRLSGPLLVEEVKGLGDAVHCPSKRLVQRMVNRYQEKGQFRDEHGLNKQEKLMLLYTLSVNPEPIVLQMFTHDEGWPFPKYIGACGRMIAERNEGLPLRTYFNAEWKTRVKLALKLMHIADQLTDNTSGFKLYFSDPNLDNYIVNSELQVIIADAENILIVDEQELEEEKPESYNKQHVSQFDTCEDGVNCLTIDIDGLCSTTLADFNYYAVCRSILSSYAQDEEGMNGGLLHSLPQNYPQCNAIKLLADECANPSVGQYRLEVKDKLILALERFIAKF